MSLGVDEEGGTTGTGTETPGATRDKVRSEGLDKEGTGNVIVLPVSAPVVARESVVQLLVCASLSGVVIVVIVGDCSGIGDGMGSV